MAEINKFKSTKPKPAVYDVADFQPDEAKVMEYQEKQAEKIERFENLAEKAEKESEARYKNS